jgi:ClpP class serine protease
MPGLQVNDADKNGFMTVIHELERSRGLDLMLHTPGRETAATESLVDDLHSMFGKDIRPVVPSWPCPPARTMTACSCKEILMGKHSTLGPIDPLLGGIRAHGVIDVQVRILRDSDRSIEDRNVAAHSRSRTRGICRLKSVGRLV